MIEFQLQELNIQIMSHRILFLVFSILFLKPVFGQNQSPAYFEDSVISFGEIVSKTPISISYFEKNNVIWKYEAYRLEDLKMKVDTNILVEIVANCKNVDTTHWTNVELKNVILTNSIDEQIDFEKAAIKLENLTKKGKKNLKAKVRNYNNAPIDKRLIHYYSRPVFDNSRKYAAIQYWYPHDGYGIILLHYIDGKWVNLGDLIGGNY